MTYIHEVFQGGGPSHFALMGEGEMNRVETERWRKDFNIQVLSISPEHDYEDLRVFLRELAAAT